MLILLGILNLPPIRRMLRALTPRIAMTDEERTPAETAQIARDVMKRMLQTPPTPHEDVPKKRTAKKKSRRK